MLKKLSSRTSSLPQELKISSSSIQSVKDEAVKYGGNSEVCEAQYRNKAVALKVLRVAREGTEGWEKRLFTAVTGEALIWRYAKHPNVTPFFGYCPERGPCLVMEWMQNGTLISFIQEHPECNRRLLVCSASYPMNYYNLHPLICILESPNVTRADVPTPYCWYRARRSSSCECLSVLECGG